MTDTIPPEIVDNEPRPCTFDPGEQTRLRCTQCGTPVCPRCMVMYETGFKCKRCVKNIQTHVTEVGPRHLAMALFCSIAAGYAYGWFYPFLTNLRFFMIAGIPVLGLILAYLTGKGVGNLIYSMTGYKLGLRMLSATLAGVILGILTSPFLAVLQELTMFVAGAQDAALATSSVVYPLMRYAVVIIASMLFIKGMVSPHKRR